eukprot:775191-Prymnesium_polylepis.1
MILLRKFEELKLIRAAPKVQTNRLCPCAGSKHTGALVECVPQCRLGKRPGAPERVVIKLNLLCTQWLRPELQLVDRTTEYIAGVVGTRFESVNTDPQIDAMSSGVCHVEAGLDARCAVDELAINVCSKTSVSARPGHSNVSPTTEDVKNQPGFVGNLVDAVEDKLLKALTCVPPRDRPEPIGERGRPHGDDNTPEGRFTRQSKRTNPCCARETSRPNEGICGELSTCDVSAAPIKRQCMA